MKITPRHQKFVETLTNSPIHIIATMRGKDQYELDKDEKGKSTVKKLGVGAKQRDGFEYEFTATFLLDQKTNMADVQKDNTHIFDNERSAILTENHGKKIIQWANTGEGYTPRVTKTVEEPTKDELATKISEIDTLVHALIDGGMAKTEVVNTISANFNLNGKPTANYNAIKDLDTANAVFNALQELKN